jgi:uncharacterized protein (TIGR00730 family)
VAAICVFCSSSQLISQHYLDLASEVGSEIARQGHTLVTGGGCVSCMGAVARSARDGGAHTVGVIPDALRLREVADLDADELIVTADMRSRKAEMDRRADGFLVLPGGLGTLEELLEIWTAKHLGMHVKPVVVLDPDGLFAPLRDQLDLMLERRFVTPESLDEVIWADSVTSAVAVFGGAIRPA